AGSCSAATRRQIAVALAAGMPGLRISPARIAAGEMTVEDAVRFALAAGPLAPIVYSSAEPADITAAQHAFGREAAGDIVEHFLATVARRLLDAGVTRFIVAGGETSGAVTHALGANILAIGPEIDPGVPWTAFTDEGRTIALALKSGNFGADDFLIKAWTMLE
ncbi:MAG TPA: nucleotide-binding domain containing protein, partial [Sphingomonas sp.]